MLLIIYIEHQDCKKRENTDHQFEIYKILLTHNPPRVHGFQHPESWWFFLVGVVRLWWRGVVKWCEIVDAWT